MAWSTITGAGTTTATKFFGDVMNKINNMLNGSDVTDTVSIHSNVTWTFKGTAFRIRDSDDSNSYIFSGANLAADRTVSLPLLTGNDTLMTADFAQLVKNKQLEDNTTTFVDETDNTKAFKFQVSGVTTGSTRVFTVPDFDATLATLAGTETFSNKTLGNSNTFTIRDDRLTLQDNSDTTKQLVFQLSGITTATTRTITVPDANITLGPTVLGLQDMWIPAGAMFPRTTTGCAALAQAETTTNKINYKVLDFDQTTQEYAQFVWQPPRNWNNGTVKVTPYWTAASGTGGVVWSVAGGAYSNDDALDTALGTAQTSTDTLIATGDLHVGPQTSAITIAGTPADSDAVIFEVSRVTGDASDTLNADARLIGISIEYTIDAATAA